MGNFPTQRIHCALKTSDPCIISQRTDEFGPNCFVNRKVIPSKTGLTHELRKYIVFGYFYLLMISIRDVLLRIQKFNQDSHNVPAGAFGHPIDFVKEHNRIFAACKTKTFENKPDLCIGPHPGLSAKVQGIAHPSKGDADKAPPHRFRDRLGKRSLPRPHKSYETKNWCAASEDCMRKF